MNWTEEYMLDNLFPNVRDWGGCGGADFQLMQSILDGVLKPFDIFGPDPLPGEQSWQSHKLFSIPSKHLFLLFRIHSVQQMRIESNFSHLRFPSSIQSCIFIAQKQTRSPCTCLLNHYIWNLFFVLFFPALTCGWINQFAALPVLCITLMFP